MAQNLPYIDLDNVINDYLNESEQGISRYFKVFHLAFRGFEDLGLDAFYRIKTVKLPVNANLTVSLPADFIQWNKIGVLNDKGEIIPLWENDKLTNFAAFSPTRTTQTQDDTLGENAGLNGWYNYWNGAAYTNIYGTPSGAPFVGSFKVDTANGLILLNEHFRYDYLMIEYISSPKEGEVYYIPLQFREALVAWLWWKDRRAFNTYKGQVGISRDLRNDYYNERRKAIAKWKPLRVYDGYAASQEFTRLTVRS